MRKSKLLLPLIPLTMVTAGIIPLVSCGGGGDQPTPPEPDPEPTDVEFSCSDSELVDAFDDRIKINWTLPTGKTVDIDENSVVFKYNSSTYQAEVLSQSSTSIEVKINFNGDYITDKEITNGVLEFDYNGTQHQVINNVNIPKFVPPQPINPLCFTDVDDGVASTINYSLIGSYWFDGDIDIQVSRDGINWSPWSGTSSITLDSDVPGNEKIYIWNKIPKLSGKVAPTTGYIDYFNFGMNNKISASGNVNSLVSYQPLTKNCFYRLFDECDDLTTAPELPSTTLAEGCYQNMFCLCVGLSTAPALPATNLADRCYNQMFFKCFGLSTAPALPATTLSRSCYSGMFEGCENLSTIPSLPATTLAPYCYSRMFLDCDDLTIDKNWFVNNIFNKQINSFGEGWSSDMFSDCNYTSDEPFILPSSEYELKPYCFSRLNSSLPNKLVTIPANYLPWTKLAEGCYEGLFEFCELKNAPVLPATALAPFCYKGMFEGCQSGLTTVPELPATTLAKGCYESMFYMCNSISTAPALPATTLAEGCYQEMFSGCSSLQTAPALPATTLVENCYSSMFCDCENLTTIPKITINGVNGSHYCCQEMFAIYGGEQLVDYGLIQVDSGDVTLDLSNCVIEVGTYPFYRMFYGRKGVQQPTTGYKYRFGLIS